MESQSNLQAHLDKRFDRLESKLDDHLDRIAKAETDIHWVKGAGKIILTIVISIVGFFAQFVWNHTGK